MKVYVSFNKEHPTEVNGNRFDEDTLASIECKSNLNGRDIAYGLFGSFSNIYIEQDLKQILHHFPKGIKPAN